MSQLGDLQPRIGGVGDVKELVDVLANGHLDAVLVDVSDLGVDRNSHGHALAWVTLSIRIETKVLFRLRDSIM